MSRYSDSIQAQLQAIRNATPDNCVNVDNYSPFVCEVDNSIAYLQSRRTMCDYNHRLVRHTPQILQQSLFCIGVECRGSFIKEQYRAV